MRDLYTATTFAPILVLSLSLLTYTFGYFNKAVRFQCSAATQVRYWPIGEKYIGYNNWQPIPVTRISARNLPNLNIELYCMNGNIQFKNSSLTHQSILTLVSPTELLLKVPERKIPFYIEVTN